MSSRFVALGSGPLPSPFPEGWYFVASRQEVQKAGLIQRTWMGETIVIWHDGKGNVCVADSFCPHLGADMGPAAEAGCATADWSVPSMASSST